LRPARKPIFCYVTDGRALARFTCPTGETSIPPPDVFLKIIRSAAEAGVDWIQIREKDLPARLLFKLVRSAIDGTQRTSCKILVNDRLDVALAAGAAGVHLGEQSLPLDCAAEWRRSSGRTHFQIGVSCHSLDAARAAESGGADYIFFGPVFATPSKAAYGPPQGVERLREVCAAVGIPVLAIGGINAENARACRKAGAAGIAAIRLFQDARDSGEIVALRETLE
jgi:thiamine-phosphate pyrophosphorylase